MVTSELTGEVSMGVLLVFLVSWRWGRYIGSDQQGDRVKLMCGEKTKTFRCTCKNVSEASVTLPSVRGGMEGIKVLMTVLLCHRQHKL